MAADKSVRRVALLTAGGLAPCLSSAVGGLIERYTAVAPDVEIIGYLDGYAGLLARRRRPHRALHGRGARRGDHRLPGRVRRAPRRPVHRGDPAGPRRRPPAA